MTRVRAQRTVLLAALLSLGACSGRGCSRPAPVAATDTFVREIPALSDECRREIRHSSVAIVAGSGPIDELFFACEATPNRLIAWAVRGHTLSRVERRTQEVASPWSVSREIATGVSELALVNDGLTGGLPIAWRAPTAQVEGLDSDEWWVISQQSSTTPLLKGSLSMPPSVAPSGIIVAARVTATGPSTTARVLTSLRDDSASHVVSHDVTLGSGEYHRLAQPPPTIAEGELRAFESTHQIFLTLAPGTASAHNTLTAWRIASENTAPAVRLGSIEVPFRYVRLVAQGTATATHSAFVFAGFERSTAPAEACITVGPSLCVRAGPLMVLEVGSGTGPAEPLAVHSVATSGLPDAIVRTDHDDGYWVLYVRGEQQSVEQFASELTDQTRAVRTHRIAGNDLPPLDHLTLRRCANRVWLGAEAVLTSEDLSGPSEGPLTNPTDAHTPPAHTPPGHTPPGHTPPAHDDRGVLAVPFSCVLRD